MFMLLFQPCLMATLRQVFTPSPLRRPYLVFGCFLMTSFPLHLVEQPL